MPAPRTEVGGALETASRWRRQRFSFPLEPSDEKRFGIGFPPSVKALIGKKVPDIETIEALHGEPPFFPSGRNAAAEHLRAAKNRSFPLNVMAHIAGAMPFAANGGRRVWLVALEGTDAGQIYEYFLDSSTLTWAASSLEELYAQELAMSDEFRASELAPAEMWGSRVRKKPSKWAPDLLWQRSLWLSRVIDDPELGLFERNSRLLLLCAPMRQSGGIWVHAPAWRSIGSSHTRSLGTMRRSPMRLRGPREATATSLRACAP